MDTQFQDLIDRLDHLSGEFDDLRELIRKAIRLADKDPEMALTRVRKVLEYVVHDAYQMLVKEPPGTRPLENLLQRLVKDGHLPPHLAPYTTLIRELGNAGTHHSEGKYKILDVNVSLIQLRSILEWYFQRVRPNAAAYVSSNPSTTSGKPLRSAKGAHLVGQKISKPRTSVAAIFSLICGLLGCVPFLTGLVAVILGIVGIKTTKNPMVTGKGMAIAGLMLGILSLAGWTAFTYALLQIDVIRLDAQQFTRDVSEGKIDAALASSVEGMDRASLVALNEKMKPWGEFKSLGPLSTNTQVINGKNEYAIEGIATFATATKSFTMTLLMENSTYKVAKFDFP
jgi:Domain of unknown function (DUF4190)/Domain of unknown function (DUF4145)